ncbi:unnamed protein product [Cuscuta epithymum]|uniref:AT-hook motif nuclear-localized protein n=1 Tax=Cuscuta epithymum TaxID=186058 RepID=A0AAV0E5Q7_9ASTE|nr:unnamed protein product [Cuscuta epithymum]
MDEKDSTDTGSAGGNSDRSESPPVGGGGQAFPPVMSMERSTPYAEPPAAFCPAGGYESGKKKRGRPRKYDSEGNLSAAFKSPPPPPLPAAGMTSPPARSFSLTPVPDYSSGRRGRGRSAASGGNWQFLASMGELFANTAGGDFTPHVVTVHTGEDVAGKVYSFAQNGYRGICILSANGSVSNVTLRQPGSSGGILTYEGRFEILRLTGSITISENCGIRSRTGGLSVSLAGPDGRVIGGGIAGLLTAATPIQMIVGSFMPNVFGKTLSRKQQAADEGGMAPVIHNAPASEIVMAARPVSQAAPQPPRAAPQPQRAAMFPTPPLPSQRSNSHGDLSPPGCNGSEATFHQQRQYPDINVSISMD